MLEKLFNQFVITFREGTEASLVIMAVMMAIKKRGGLPAEVMTGFWEIAGELQSVG